MILKVIGSNSAGNAYLLVGANGTLLIECGVHIDYIKAALKYRLQNVSCIVTHAHGDHAKSIAKVLDAGIPVFANIDTLKAKGVDDHHRSYSINAGKTFTASGFRIKPFPVNHDVPCFGYLIEHEECGRVVFLTDTSYSDYKFPGLHNMIVEANHDVEIMENNGTPGFLKERIIGSHMNLNTCREMIMANDLSQVNNIVLIHLSDSNSDARRFKREIESSTGKNVHIAVAGMEIPFNKTPF